ncbi:hypothetical protein CEXT_687831 [Caerostris extrusa]|uniref:Uncharacterized protein n=1 Tax=Caerostris extrusa TaxID=172846 RepID=A0AAV4QTL1_CAEEX|nr:hypothetical protein CEXT_687831 [Caerostris extrusa]
MATGHLPSFTTVEFNYFFSCDKALYVEIRAVYTSNSVRWLKNGKNFPICYRSVDEIPFSLKTVYPTALGKEGNLHSIIVAALCKLCKGKPFFGCLSPYHVPFGSAHMNAGGSHRREPKCSIIHAPILYRLLDSNTKTNTDEPIIRHSKSSKLVEVDRFLATMAVSSRIGGIKRN